MQPFIFFEWVTYIHCISIDLEAGGHNQLERKKISHNRKIFNKNVAHDQFPLSKLCVLTFICSIFVGLVFFTSLVMIFEHRNCWNAIWRWMAQMYSRTCAHCHEVMSNLEIKVIINVSSWSRCQFWVTLATYRFASLSVWPNTRKSTVWIIWCCIIDARETCSYRNCNELPEKNIKRYAFRVCVIWIACIIWLIFHSFWVNGFNTFDKFITYASFNLPFSNAIIFVHQ